MSRTQLVQAQRARGAQPGSIGAFPLTLSFGNSAPEYRALRDTVAIIDRADLSQIRMWGKDPVRMLNGLITNDLARASGGQSVYAAILTPKGRMISDVRAIVRAGSEPREIIIDVPALSADNVAAHFGRYVPPLFARWERAALGVIGVYGPRSAEVVRTVLGIEANSDEDAVVVGRHGILEMPIVGTRIAGGEIGFDVFVPEGSLVGVWEDLMASAEEAGGGPAGFEALEAVRTEAGRPRFGLDMTEESMPAEVFASTGLMDRAVSFRKGCYTGQEVVVRIAHRGHVNRNLRGLLLGDAEPPPPRTAIYADDGGREIGWTTTALHSPLMNQTISLAMVRREVESGGRVRIGEPGGPLGIASSLPFSSE